MKPSFISMSAQRACTVFALTFALVGCGGDGSSSPPAPPARGELLLAGISYSSNNAAGNTLLIVEADKPTAPRLSVSVDDHLAAAGLAIDPTTRIYSFLGDSMVYFVKSGQLFQVSLHKEDSTVVQRISSLTTACKVDDWHPLKVDGSDDAWVQVSEAGPDGDCTQEADNRNMFVRTGTPVTTAATALPAGVEMLTSLPDLSLGALGFFLALDQRGATPKLTLYSATWVSLGDVAGGEGLSELEVLGFLPGPTLGSSGYARSGASLRRLTWSSTGASLSAPLYTLASAPAISRDVLYLVDDVAMYFIDGLSVLRISAAGAVSPLGSLNPAMGDHASLAYAMTSSHLVLQQQHGNNDNSSSLHALLKSGGTPVPLAAGASAARAYAIHGDDLIYHSFTGNRVALRRIHLNGSNDRFIADLGSGYSMPVYSPNFISFSGLRLDAVAWCENAGNDANCHNGALKSLDLSTGVTTTLGSFSHAGNVTSWFAYAPSITITGQPMVIQTYAYDSTSSLSHIDMYVARPQTANSLVRVSHNAP